MSIDLKIDETLNYYRRINIPGGDLRISIVNDCNMRCYYCHNEGQGEFTAKRLKRDEIKQIIELGKKFGIHKVRLTGGEPLLHPDLVNILRMVKFELQIDNVGINTNGILLKKNLINELISCKTDVIIVGIDYYESAISKASKIGKTSREILKNVLLAKELGLNIQIATVYDGKNYSDIFQLANWCNSNNILFKVLEISDTRIASNTSESFLQLIYDLQHHYNLKLGKTISLNEIYGIHENGNKILFFHSKCRTRECNKCNQMHMRVTSFGKAKPCILRTDTEFDILNSKNPFNNMAKAVHNLGNPPENPVI